MKRWPGIFMVLMALAAGCGSSSKPSAAPTTRPPTATTLGPGAATSLSTLAGPGPSSTGPSSSNSPSSEGPVETTVPASPAPCSTRQLAAALGSANGTAGTIYYQLELRNVGGDTCFVQGYPGVSFVAGTDGHQVGSPASRVAGPTPPVVLTPDRSAAATLAIVDASNYGTACQLTPVLGLRVYPPDQTAALFVPHADQACARIQYPTLRTGPLHPA